VPAHDADQGGWPSTVWCQQHDPITLAPASARNYEMPSKSGAESANIMLFLMDLPNPDSRVVASVHAAADWFKKAEIRDMVWENAGSDGRKLVAKRVAARCGLDTMT